MKMHSYSQINKQFREKYLKAQKERTTDETSTYPKNITLKDFSEYMWMPTLIYQDVYPRTEKIQFKFVIYTSLKTFLLIVIGYVWFSDYVTPIIKLGYSIYWFEMVLRLIYPLIIFNFLIFYIVFELILQILAELTRFADRQFYLDWWNSHTFQEFYTKWNRPVNQFLYVHVY